MTVTDDFERAQPLVSHLIETHGSSISFDVTPPEEELDFVLVDPIPGQPLLLSNGKSAPEFVADINSGLTATAVALRKRTSEDIILESEFVAPPDTIINDCQSVTGWTTTNGLGSAGTTANSTHGGLALSVQLLCGLSVASARGSLRLNVSPALSVGTNEVLAVDLAIFNAGGPGGASPSLFNFTVSDGVGFTGNLKELNLGSLIGAYQTYYIPLAGLSTIASIGIRCIGNGQVLGDGVPRQGFLMDYIRFPGQIEQGLLVPPSDTTYTSAPVFGSTVVDLRPTNTVIHRLNGKRYAHEWELDPTGVLDCTIPLARAVSAVAGAGGGTLELDADAQYHMNGALGLSGIRNVIIEGNGASLIRPQTNVATGGMVSFGGAYNVEIRDLHVFGGRYETFSGSTLAAMSGTPMVSGTTYLLDAQDEAVKDATNYYYARDVDGYNSWSWTLSDTAHVLSDCEIGIYDDAGNLLGTQTLTLTGTPTAYRIDVRPRSLGTMLFGYVKKLTATANTITVGNRDVFRRVAYHPTEDDGCPGFSGSGSEFCTIRDCSAEGMGDAMQVSASPVACHDLLVSGFFGRGCRRQGMSFNYGHDMVIEDFVSRESGRSTLDVEPYGTGVVIQNLTFRRGYLTHHHSPSIGMAGNNPTIIGLHLEDIYCVGDISFTAAQATYRNVQAGGFYVKGADIQIENVNCQVAEVRGPRGTVRGVNLLSDASGQYLAKFKCDDPTVLVTGVKMDGTNTTFQDIEHMGGWAYITGAYSGVDTGRWKTWFPNQFKAKAAFSDVWVPGGMNHHAEPVRGVKAISGTVTKANNLRGIAVPMVTGATTATVTFQGEARTIRAPTVTFAAAAGTNVPAGTYRYRYGGRTVNAGPATWSAETSAVTLGAIGRVLINAGNFFSHGITIQDYIEGFTFLRGTTPGGPYTYRCDVMLTHHPWAYGVLSGVGPFITFYDDNHIGSVLLNVGNSSWPAPGVFTATGQTGSFTAVNEQGWEPDANYAVQVTPSWDTSVSITAKRRDGFDLAFSAAPAGATLDWLLIR